MMKFWAEAASSPGLSTHRGNGLVTIDLAGGLTMARAMAIL